MGNSTSQALMLRPAKSQEHVTVFGQFMANLLKRHAKEQQNVLVGQGHLIGMPVEIFVLSGLWVVMEKIAQKIGLSLSTQTDVDMVAERVNRIINAGILLVYRDPASAAMAFEERVLDVVEYAMGLGYRSGMSIPAQAWEELIAGRERIMRQAISVAKVEAEGSIVQLAQIPAAFFFAGIMKAAREYKEQLRKTWELFQASNVIGNNLDDPTVGAEGARLYSYFNTLNLETKIEGCLKMLDESYDGNPWAGKDFAGLLNKVNRLRFGQKVLSSFVVNTEDWPASVGDVVVNDQWLNTQILLAAIDASEDEQILPTAEVYAEAVTAVKRFTEDEMLERALRYLNKKASSKFAPEAIRWLKTTLAHRIEEILTWEPKVFTELTLDTVLVNVTDGNWLVDTKSALAIAMDTPHNPFERIKAHQPDPDAWLEARVIPAIVWDDLTIDQALQIVNARVLPLSALVTGVVSISRPKIRDQVMKRIGNLSKKEPQLLSMLIEHGYSNPEVELVTANLDSLSAEALEICFLHFMKLRFSEKNPAEPKALGEIIWRVLGRLKTEVAQRMVNTLEWRESFYVLVSEANDLGSDVPWNTFDRLKETLGERQYYLLLLGVEAKQRAHDFQLKEKGESVVALLPWEQMYEDPKVFGSYIPLRAFGPKAKPADAKKILQTITEEEAFRWAQAHKRNVNQLWEKALAAQKRYFEAQKKKTTRKKK